MSEWAAERDASELASDTAPFLGLFSSDSIPDERILNRLLRELTRSIGAVAYYAAFVPQVGAKQGERVTLSFKISSVPERVREYIHALDSRLNLAQASPRKLTSTKIENLCVTSIGIASRYNINLGHVFLVHGERISEKRLTIWLDIFESMIEFRKEARALYHHRRFFGLDREHRDGLDQSIGSIVHSAIHPHRSIIFVPDDKEIFRATYISDVHPDDLPDNCLHIRRGKNKLTQACDNRRISTAQNIGGSAELSVGELPTGIEVYAGHHKFSSCVIAPVFSEKQCFCLIVCFFKRPNAVSIVEERIVSSMAGLLSDYYRIWYRNREVERTYAEADGVLKQVRELLLIVDVLHDAAEDLTTARGHLGMIDPRTDFEKDTLKTSKAILDSLITATNHFKSFYGRRDGRNVSERVSQLRTNFRPDKISPSIIMAEIADKYKGQLAASKINLSIACHKDFHFWGVEHCVRRSIDNAVKNAVYQLQYKSHVKRAIDIRLKLEDKHVPPAFADRFNTRIVVIEIEDNGPGVSPDVLDTVRQRYVSHRGGMGLGVPIMEAACETHGGSLDLTSVWGQNFRVVLRFREMIGGVA